VPASEAFAKARTLESGALRSASNGFNYLDGEQTMTESAILRYPEVATLLNISQESLSPLAADGHLSEAYQVRSSLRRLAS